jgi:hypothetical protein
VIACVDDSSCKTGRLPGSPQMITVTYTVQSAVQGDVLGPNVVTAGQSGTVVLHGRGFTHATGVQFGGTPATSVSVTSDSEILAGYPALPAGSYAVSIDSGAVAFSAMLQAVAAPGYAAAKLPFPTAPQEIGGMVYDALRQAIYVAARYSDSSTNQLVRFQFSNGAWQSPASVPMATIRDVALAPDGNTLLVATDTGITAFDPGTLAASATYSLPNAQVGSGTLHIEKLAPANDGYVFVTTGGVNPSSAYLFSTTQHAFYEINHALSLVEDSPLAQLYFGNPGVSGNGSCVAVSQDPRTTAIAQGQSQPALYAYISQGQNGAGLYNILSFTATDRDRSQSPLSARPALDFNGAHIVVNGPKTTVYNRLGSLGLLPDTTRAVALSRAVRPRGCWRPIACPASPLTTGTITFRKPAVALR